jgi:murein DD-endopeptidase MepM/ murein hydrolase activator NlpD
MRAPILHVVVRSVPLVALALVLSACDATWPGGAVNAPPPRYQSRCASPLAVRAGDTVYSVARRCEVSVRELIEVNHLQPPYMLSAGMSLRLPGVSEYVVQHGDTLSGVAHRNHVDFQALASVNGKRPPYVIRVGEHLRIPASYGGSSAGIGGGTMVVASPNSTGRREPVPPPPRPRQPEEETPSAPSPAAVASLAPPPPPPRPSPSGTQAEAPAAAAAPLPGVPPEPAAASGRGFLWPVKGEVVLGFGPQPGKGQNNDGINIAAPAGTPVHAAENGVVAYVGNELKGFGNLILVKHADGWMTAYAHADRVEVRRGDTVRRGQEIATVGATGSVTAPQLHFEIRHGTEAVDPTEHLRDGPVS